MALQEILPEIRSRGASLVTLSPQLPDYTRRWVEEDGVESEVLSDLGNGVARRYGLVFRMQDELVEVYRETLGIDLERFNGDDSWELPVPATFVLHRDGSVVHVAADADYTRRPEPSALLAVLDGMV